MAAELEHGRERDTSIREATEYDIANYNT